MITWSKVNPSVLTLANELIYEHHPWLAAWRIGFVFRSDGMKKNGRITIGNTSKVSPKYTPHLALDYLIWLALDTWENLTAMQRKALVDHELCHIDTNGRLRGHDVEEFGEIIRRYGLWTPDLFRLQETFERACQLRLPVGEGGVLAVDPSSLPESEGDGESDNTEPDAELEEAVLSQGLDEIIQTGKHREAALVVNMDAACTECGEPGAVQNGLCLGCLGDRMAESDDET